MVDNIIRIIMNTKDPVRVFELISIKDLGIE